MTVQQITYLITRQLKDDLSAEEARLLDEWAAKSPGNQLLLEDFNDPELLARFLQVRHETNAVNSVARIRDRVKNSIHGKHSSTTIHRTGLLKMAWIRYAAAVIIIFAIGAYFYTTQEKRNLQIVETKPAPVKSDILPGSDRAILTLSSGQQIVLDSAASETIQEGTLSIENNNGQLIYFNRRSPGEGGKKDQLAVMNTMSTPKGGQYQLTLSDGTKVWLNAASSITYPTSFTSTTREVAITGEAYFEVSKNAAKPFIVKAGNEKIVVLGTEFNVNDYPDETAMKASLVEGVIKVGENILKPNQAFINGKVIATNLTQDVAWKNGKFNFENLNVEQAMRQLARWYDIEVVYLRKPPDIRFFGSIDRGVPLSVLVRTLEKSRVKLRIEGKKLILY